MLNVNELETRWRKHKVLSFMSYIIIVLSIIIIVILIYMIYNSRIFAQTNSKVEQLIPINDVKINKQIHVQNAKNTVQEHNNTSNKQKKVILTLSPSFTFISNMQENTALYYEKDEENINKQQNYSVKKVKPKKKETEKKETEKKVYKAQPPIIEKNSINIKRQNTQEDISLVIKRFKKNNDPELSLFVAKKYYELKNYNQAYNYALITNAINDNIDASWIVFSKSLVKLNKKNEAVKTLKKYINHSHSNQAKILLDEIISGKFQ